MCSTTRRSAESLLSDPGTASWRRRRGPFGSRRGRSQHRSPDPDGPRCRARGAKSALSRPSIAKSWGRLEPIATVKCLLSTASAGFQFPTRSTEQTARPSSVPGGRGGPLRIEKGLSGKPMPQRLALGATFLLPKTVGDFTDPLRGILFVLHEPGMLVLREALRIIFRHKIQELAIDGESRGLRALDHSSDLESVQPPAHRAETFKLSTDPLFVEKVRDIVGL